MALPWIRLDTSMPDNPKILGLLAEKDGHRAAFVWISALTYAGKHGTDGFIPHEAVSKINGRNVDMARLVNAGFLIENGGGWEIKSWDEYQVSDEESQKRRSKAQYAASVRWSKERARRDGHNA
jgi:hypothetical protein